VVPPSLGDPIKQKTRQCCNGIQASLTHYSGTAGNLRIPSTLITAVYPLEATHCFSLQELRGPFTTGVCAASHQPLLSVTPYQRLLFLINVCYYLIIAPIIGQSGNLSSPQHKKCSVGATHESPLPSTKYFLVWFSECRNPIGDSL